MNPKRQTRKDSRSGERGYALLMAFALTLMLLVASTAMIANIRIEAKRQREDEAIWRGEQYVRAIRLYYHKVGHYPQNLDELSKGLPQLHFLRQAYKDPLNKSDGAWRFIYVNAAGQIIGSTKYTSLQQMAYYDSGGTPGGLLGQGPPGLGTPVSSLTNSSGFGGPAGSSSEPAQTPPPAPTDPNAQGQPPNQNPEQPGQSPDGNQPPGSQPQPNQNPPGTGGQSPFTSLNGQPTNPIDNAKPTGPVDGPVLGAFLTGVASKVEAPSQKVYHRGKTYLGWEFIWNPLEEAASNLQQTLNPQGQQPGIGQPIGPGTIGQPMDGPLGAPQPGTPQPQPQQQ
ncbi:MAG TPA: hypothetical protein VMJ13_09230 [Candidatus Acidoferrum sp.]|nr:hypothetical protein [Candidatus Acidoferrum sp.]